MQRLAIGNVRRTQTRFNSKRGGLSHYATNQRAAEKDADNAVHAFRRLQQIQQQITALHAAYRRSLWKCVLGVYDIALDVVDSQPRWDKFCDLMEHAGHPRPKIDHTSDKILHHVLVYAIGSSRADKKRVSRYFADLVDHFRRGTSSEEIEKELVEGGGFAGLRERRKVNSLDPNGHREEALSRASSHRSLSNSDDEKTSIHSSFPNKIRTIDGLYKAIQDCKNLEKSVDICRQELSRSEGLSLISVLDMAYSLLEGEGIWKEFCKLSAWVDQIDHPSTSFPDKALYYCMKHVSPRLSASEVTRRLQPVQPLWDVIISRRKERLARSVDTQEFVVES